MQTLILRRIYSMASLVERCIETPEFLEEVDWNSPEILNCLVKYSKTSLLHYYIWAMISTWVSRNYRKDGDCYDMDDITDIDDTLTAYDIPHQSFESYCSLKVPDEDDDPSDDFYNWHLSQKEAFYEMWEKMTEEVFYLLFGNRAFLLKFNLAVSQYLQTGVVRIPLSFTDKKGVIKRQHVPTWVKKAVYCRDRARCVFCNKDLSGILCTDRRSHYDHIVPLNLWGINDPCNLQLLCDTCNLQKSGGQAETGFLYSVWWETDNS
ncbi:MAG TPA: HNH endonuclease [Blastocatellia bacterium]|nr:HNH endonuclease [Blastocatellia bacterium]